MGARQTKTEGSDLPNELSPQRLPLRAVNDIKLDAAECDPRSPNGQRTPINRVSRNALLVHVEDNDLNSASDNPLQHLRKRFFKEFTYNINDPRSPSVHLNRTPLIFEDSNDRTLDLDDTFADLFVESNIPAPVVVVPEEVSENIEDVSKPQDVEKTKGSPVIAQQKFDPRSPSAGVDRTPIIFSDDENDASEDVLLENILATMTLNLDASGNSSMISMQSSDAVEANGVEDNVLAKPANKHLDRVRDAQKPISRGPNRRQKRLLRQKIYQDRENLLPSTPQMKMRTTDVFDSPKEKRTPLSCMKNRSQLRSRSVESSAKSVKTHLSLKSFDDILNPGENQKIADIRLMCEGSQGTFDF